MGALGGGTARSLTASLPRNALEHLEGCRTDRAGVPDFGKWSRVGNLCQAPSAKTGSVEPVCILWWLPPYRSGQAIMKQSVVENTSREDTVVRSKDAKVELGRQNCASNGIWRILPVPYDDIGMLGCCYQCQHSSNDGCIGLALKGFRVAEVNAQDHYSALRGLPEEGLVAAALDCVGLKFGQTARRICKHQYPTMCTVVVTIWSCWCTESRPTTYCEVLTDFTMSLWVQARFSKNVNFTFPRPVPVNDLAPKVRDITIAELVVVLSGPCTLARAGVQGWVIVWLLWWWEASPDLLWCLEGVDVDCPNLRDLAGQLRGQKWQVSWSFAVICQPHQVPVDQDGKIVSCVMCLASVTDEDCRRKFSGGARKSIQRSWHCEGTICHP